MDYIARLALKNPNKQTNKKQKGEDSIKKLYHKAILIINTFNVNY